MRKKPPQGKKWASSNVWNMRPEDDVREIALAVIGPDGNVSKFLNECVKQANPDALAKAVADRLIAGRQELAKKSAEATRLIAEMKKLGASSS